MKPQTPRRRNSAAWSLSLLVFVVSIGIGAYTAHASTTSGTITQKYAWSNVGGWVNFGATNGGVTVTDTGLTGYAWSANDGWINLAPAQGGVKNDGEGNLSGFAWDAGAGWVDFSAVKINSSGKFTGTATGGTVNGASYKISFDCANCDVETTWRPTTITTTTTTTTSSGSISPVYAPPPSQTGPSPSEAGQSNPLPGSPSASAQQNALGNPSSTIGSSGVGAVGASGQGASSWLPTGQSTSTSSPHITASAPARAPTPTQTSGEFSGAKFIQSATVPVSIVAVALLVIFLLRFFF